MRVGSTTLPRLTIPRSAGRRHGWKPPYALPNAGEVVSISTNYASDVAPAGIGGAANWNYAVFGAYTGGAIIEDYSPGGAYVIAGSGGHAAPPNVGAAIFDFADATWKRKDNTNGVAYQSTDFLAAEIDTLYGEIIAASTPGIPAPAHIYGNVGQRRAGYGGGAQGSFVRLVGLAAAIDSSRGSDWAHAFDLATGRWSRVSTNAYGTNTFYMSALDSVSGRYWMPQYQIHDGLPIEYLDSTTWAFTGIGFGAADLGPAYSVFVDPIHQFLIIHTAADQLRGIDLNNIGGGATTLTVSGTMPAGEYQSQWQYFPPDGCFYMFSGYTTTATINKLRPPPFGTDPLVGTWTVSTVTLNTALTQIPAGWFAAGDLHYTRFVYVPSIGCLAWIPGDENTTTTPVVICKPPA